MRVLVFHVVCLILDALVLGGVMRRVPRAVALVALGIGLLAPVLFVGWVHPGEMLSFSILHLATLVLFVHGPLLACGVAVVLRARKRLAMLAVAVAIVLLATACRAFVYEPHALLVRRYTVESAKITRPFRIVVLADIQTDRVGAYERDVLARAMAERPSLLLFPGDYVQLPLGARRDAETAKLGALVARMHAPLGGFAVEGNVDPRGHWQRVFAGSSIRALDTTTRVETGEIAVTALSFADSFDPALVVERERGFHVVFGHGPDFALGDVRADLLVAGHTHGGQVVLPFFGPPITASLIPRAWAGGRTALDGGRTLIVSRGIGMERATAPRLRFLCPPELVVIDVRPTP